MATRSLQLRRKNSLADPRHLMRFLKSQVPGMTLDEIAKAEGVSVATVSASINQIDSYRNANSQGEMELAIRNIMISVAPQATETIRGLLTATEQVQIPDPRTGKNRIVRQDDKTTRLEASRLVKDMIIGMQPKGPAVEVNVKQTNQTANISSAETNEERMQRLRKQAQEFNQLPPEVAAVPASIDAGGDAEIINADDDDEDDE
jgi:Bacterial regulatory proteins, lacI family